MLCQLGTGWTTSFEAQNSMSRNDTDQTLYSIPTLARRWTVSVDTIRRHIFAGDLRSVNIGSRRMIPLDEVRRAETKGIGKARRSAMSAEVAATK